MAIHLALLLALFGSLVLTLVLWRWAGRVAGARPLMGFLLGVCVWIAGNELPTWFGPGTARLGLGLLATAAVTAAAFFHFAVAFTGSPARRFVPAAYAGGTAATLLSVVFTPGAYQPFAGLDYVAVPNGVGWCTSLAWAALAGAGLLVLARAWRGRAGLARRQLVAVLASSGWGLASMSGYAVAALHLPMAPWPLLGLPAYPVFLVYGILRYELLVANAWARRALGWTLLVAAAGLVVAAVPLLPVGTGFGAQFATAAAVGAAFLVLGGPARRLASRIIYPGGTVTPAELAGWRAELASASTDTELARRAETLLSRHLHIPVRAAVGGDPPATAEPLLWCRRIGAEWGATLQAGWDAAPPGPRRVAEMMGAALAEEAGRLERAVSLAERERERQTRARLAELGALAATVAHDVRNPLNIIGMAVAGADPEVRAEVRDQVRRIARLADDLLDYAKPWGVQAAPMDLAELLRRLAARRGGAVDVRMPDVLPVHADAGRVEQAVENLLDNACAAAVHVMLDADQVPGAVRLHVCDDGPGIPEGLRERVFEPFVSRAPGGTGLGLAIVARIAAAHGGAVALTERPGWSTCVTLTLPA